MGEERLRPRGTKKLLGLGCFLYSWVPLTDFSSCHFVSRWEKRISGLVGEEKLSPGCLSLVRLPANPPAGYGGLVRCVGSSFNPGEQRDHWGHLLLLGQMAWMAFFSGTGMLGFPLLCYSSSPMVLNKLAFFPPPFRVPFWLSLMPFSGFIVVLGKEK